MRDLRWGWYENELRWAQLSVLKDVSHGSFLFTTSTFSLREVSHEMRFWEIDDARNAMFCSTKRTSDGWDRSAARRWRPRSAWVGLCSDRPRVGTDGSGFVLRNFNFQFWKESLARKLRFHKLKLQFNCDTVAAISFCQFFSFLPPVIFLLNFLLQRRQNHTLVLDQRRAEKRWEDVPRRA